MKNFIIPIIIIVIIIATLGMFALYKNQNSSNIKEDMMMTQQNGMDDTSISEPVEKMMVPENSMVMVGSYSPYTPQAYEATVDTKRILFFHATWCPTCKVANDDFEQNVTNIPSDVTVFKTDYDTETELKKKYNITYQHTFVQVDIDGNPLAVWNGGGVNELIANLK